MEGDRVLGRVGHEDREGVALGEAARRQAGREAAHRSLELGVAQRATGGAVDQGRLVCEGSRAAEDEGAEIYVGDLGLEGLSRVDHGSIP